MTSVRFRESIRASIANPSLQAALDANAERRVTGRIAAFASLPDWRARRQKAHAIRAEVIARLDEYLDLFTAKATQNGIIVHLAKNAAEANRIIIELVRQGPRKNKNSAVWLESSALIAKSKSMVSEEIELNHALEDEGHRVVETDLGEYIVQLRGEKPAHIITPAVHLRRHEIGQLFQEKLDLQYTEDIPTLTNAARSVLREIFLTADVGISGVNFGVADTGTLCIVTNEGNGRMVTTIPPVHIALMGMERLVPSLDDLALMLSLLPRSATGQKLSVYTQLIHSPRRPDEADGAQQRHLVILDNGRSHLRKNGLQEALYCIRCGACLNACPVFREIGGHAYVGEDGSIAPYPGPIGSIVSPGLLGLPQFGHLAQASSLCGACKDACPVDIDLPKLLTRVRAGSKLEEKKQEGVGLSFFSKAGLRLYGRIASSPRLFIAAQKLGAFGMKAASPFTNWMWLPSFTGWGTSKDFPRIARKTFRDRFRHQNIPNTNTLVEREIPIQKEEVKHVKENMLERFVEELAAVGGRASRVRKAELSGSIIELLRNRSIDAVMMWDHVPNLEEAILAQSGIRVTKEWDPGVTAGITGATAGIADTGTLVIPSGKGRALSSSLLPPIHIAVIEAAQIVSSLEEALVQEELHLASATALVTGPSRTADIEMTLTIGVHGPKELIVYIVE